MTRNQKIALGCGGAGCLGLIVVAVACLLIFYFGWRRAGDTEWYTNSNANSNRNVNLNSNDNTNDDSTNSSSSSNSSPSSSSSSTYSDDEKHRLFHAASMTADFELQRRVWTKLGILDDDYSTGDKFRDFGVEHGAWILRNYQWVAEIDTPEEGRAYVNEHLR
jgi:hypothetical protein